VPAASQCKPELRGSGGAVGATCRGLNWYLGLVLCCCHRLVAGGTFLSAVPALAGARGRSIDEKRTSNR